jgi:hypothetical protein
MKILLYFDWTGTIKELKEHNKKMQKSCIETGVEHEGLYGQEDAEKLHRDRC